MQLSKNFTLEELCYSLTAVQQKIDNKPSEAEIDNLKALCTNILQPLRDWFGKPITIGSGYRCQKLNKAVGGVSNSRHTLGEAVDICIDGDLKKGRAFFDWIKTHCKFDQLIWEHNAKGSYWVHVSYKKPNRMQAINDLLKK